MSVWRLCAAFCMLLLSVPGVIAQTPSTQSEVAPSREQVMKFLEVTQAKSRVEQVFTGMAKQAQMGAELGFKQKVPDASPEQLARVDAISDSIFKEFSVDELIDAIVPIYQKHLSKSDLDGILAFYASPTGQKLLKEMPAILSESMEAGGEIGRKKMESINRRVEEQLQQMILEEQEKRQKDQQRQPSKD
jgi:uncharacterized protein